MSRLLIATHNQGKLRELEQALRFAGIEVVGLDALADTTEVEETGATFDANARLKAEGYSQRTDLPVLADDSGLEVDALDCAPGVHSARYGGPELDDLGRCRHLLDEFRNVGELERRTGRFRCVLALARAGETLAVFEGAVEGQILHEPRGDGGFGYDPLFFHPPSNCAFAELSREQKRAVSHRGRAIDALLAAIRAGDPRLAGLVDV